MPTVRAAWMEAGHGASKPMSADFPITKFYAAMSEKDMQKRLHTVLLNDGDMSSELFEDQLMPDLDYFRNSMKEDGDEIMFVLTERSGDIAMVLMDASEKIYFNADARARLKQLWPRAYESNMEVLIPGFAEDLSRGEYSMSGVKTGG